MYKPQMENKMMQILIENKTSVDLHGLKKDGGQMLIDADENGTPLDKHFRRRMRDKSIQIVKPETKKVIKKNKEDE
jgi:5S rRNA maturation endonuclease (ribonuclease M5)